jgi:hypothetical protein
MTDAAFMMCLCFAAGYAVRAGMAARERRRRIFRS